MSQKEHDGHFAHTLMDFVILGLLWFVVWVMATSFARLEKHLGLKLVDGKYVQIAK